MSRRRPRQCEVANYQRQQHNAHALIKRRQHRAIENLDQRNADQHAGNEKRQPSQIIVAADVRTAESRKRGQLCIRAPYVGCYEERNCQCYPNHHRRRQRREPERIPDRARAGLNRPGEFGPCPLSPKRFAPAANRRTRRTTTIASAPQPIRHAEPSWRRKILAGTVP